ncbi:hypothetical protein PYCCODRAFT_1476918 [Trametes coccinea BRFM310]|uniref:Uncharacterized protein n=1 Tax=Trametes coccinea (strain BRFM310) TaxID=1353009 RepID=A0A1Y2IUA3_TRAC3|nr:hypothetical protein PYCCODRAFT_1476918 [Trametes coccinea BRFM310]
MASQDADTSLSPSTPNSAPSGSDAVDTVVEAVAKASLQDEVATDVDQKISDSPPRPLKIYARPDLLFLSKSPLVGLPEGMPAFKDWFGDWNEQVGSKKESESTTTTTARDRRFRRDADDGDSARASFRSGLTQPSQMGNFRHQSIRTTERGSEKDVDRERERDLRDREGQERLRNLSDKYDRDRLALSSASALRNKDRDAAPHLSGTTTTRLGQTTTAGRRTEVRDTSKRKTGESSDDWRRGAEPSRAGRDDNRDTRDRPRSRVRDSSRTRRDPSTSRRDRDREDRDRPRRGDGNRDDRREKDDTGRRDRDDYLRRDWDDSYDRDRFDYSRRNKDDGEDDPRRWRDDGRREERLAARRDRDRWDRFEERDRERPSAGDERDTRTRRAGGRERRLGGSNDDGKDREDRRDRDKDREAEPAWMETYVPTTPGAGILGGKGADGELDGIQAWKKGMKEKERKEKAGDAPEGNKAAPANGAEQQGSSTAENALDEIQMFKLMMKREAEKKEGEKPQNGHPELGPPGLSNSSSVQTSRSDSVPLSDPAIIVQTFSDGSKAPLPTSSERSSPHPAATASPSNATQQSLNVLTSDTVALTRGSESSGPSLDRPLETSRVMGPRLSQVASAASLAPPTELASSTSSHSTFNPPSGSRVLAFKSRTPTASHGPAPSLNQISPPGLSAPQGQTLGSSTIPAHLSDPSGHETQYGAPRVGSVEGSRGVRSFSPLSNGSQLNMGLDEMRESVHLGQFNEGIRRASGSSAAERAILGVPGESGPPFNEIGGPYPPGVQLDGSMPGGANFAANKGSRFAKFFDARTREAQAAGPRLGQQVSPAPPAIPHPRQEPLPLGGVNMQRERTMEDIFAMLQSSSQNHRMSPQIPQPGRIPQGGNQFAPNNIELQLLQQQQQQQLQQQQLAQNNRLDALYDSRLDDRNFVPDGLVPGLRPAPPRSRSRESGGVLFNEQIDDPLHFNVQRLTQQRNMEQMYNGPVPSMYTQQPGMVRNGGLPMQQGQFRGASPISSQNPLQPPSQRLPPGLANLGGRPPHDPSQFLGAGVGMPGGGLHGASPAQQVYNTFTQGNLGYNGNPQMRGPPGPQNPLSINAMGGLGPNNIDLRAANQAQLLGMAQGNLGGAAGLRGSGPGFGPQQGPAGQLAPSHIAMRQQLQQQQQQHLPPQMMPHLLPSHLQQQGVPGGNAQTTQDLMALLMGGHRE